MRIISSSGLGPLTTEAISQPKTGREFFAARLTLGISARKVAEELGIDVAKLQRWERGVNVLDDANGQVWQQALRTAARKRVEEIGRGGLTVADLSRTPLGKVLAVYTKAR